MLFKTGKAGTSDLSKVQYLEKVSEGAKKMILDS